MWGCEKKIGEERGITKCAADLPEEGFKDIAFFAYDDFLVFTRVFGAFAAGAANIPAHMAAIEFPCRAFFLLGAVFPLPAGNDLLLTRFLVDEKEIEVFLGMLGDISPALFVTVNGTNRHSKEFGQLFLSFAKLAAGKIEFVLGHDLSRYEVWRFAFPGSDDLI